MLRLLSVGFVAPLFASLILGVVVGIIIVAVTDEMLVGSRGPNNPNCMETSVGSESWRSSLHCFLRCTSYFFLLLILWQCANYECSCQRASSPAPAPNDTRLYALVVVCMDCAATHLKARLAVNT